jgi:hypothetical protein
MSSGRRTRLAWYACALALLAASAVMAPVNAADPSEPPAGLADPAVTLALEAALADALASRPPSDATEPFAERAEAVLDWAMALAAQPPEQVAKQAMALDACAHAGLALNRIVLGLADGEITPQRQAGGGPPSWTLAGDLAEAYAEAMGRCERLRNLPASPRRIGPAPE